MSVTLTYSRSCLSLLIASCAREQAMVDFKKQWLKSVSSPKKLGPNRIPIQQSVIGSTAAAHIKGQCETSETQGDQSWPTPENFSS